MRVTLALLFMTLAILPKPGFGQGLTEVPLISVEGRPVEKMELYVTEGDSVRTVTGQEYADFISHFHLQNKDLFNQSVYDLKAKKMGGLD